jgi:hypothetical protein
MDTQVSRHDFQLEGEIEEESSMERPSGEFPVCCQMFTVTSPLLP